MARTKKKAKLSGTVESTLFEKALQTKKPTPEQKKLRELWSTLNDILLNRDDFEFDSPYISDPEDDVHEISVYPDGQTFVHVIRSEIISVPLSEFCGDDEKQAALLEDAIQSQLSMTLAKPTGKKASKQ
jgi:hypothetical protein